MEFDASGKPIRKLYTQETPTVRAGNRFSYFPPVIDFSYEAVLNNLIAAIEKEGENGAKVVDYTDLTQVEVLNFADVRAEAQSLWTQILSSATSDEDKEDRLRALSKKIEIIFGHPMKLSEVTEDQADLLQLVVLEMRDMV